MPGKRATRKDGKFRMRRLASLITLLSTGAALPVQAQTQPKLPTCKASFSYLGKYISVTLYKRSNNHVVAGYRIPLQRVKLQSAQGLNTAGTQMTLNQTASLSGYPTSSRITFKMGKSARNGLPRPTGCSFFVDGKPATQLSKTGKVNEPILMSGIDSTAVQPQCSFTIAQTHMAQYGNGRTVEAHLHDAFRKHYVIAKYNMAISSGLKSQLNSATASLRTDMNAGRCKASASGCFLTTAACEIIGLEDDCWELQSLRRFRDNWLQQQPDGVQDIAQYYAQAPAICEKLKSSADGRRKLLQLYWTRILPSAVAARLGLNQLTRRIYTKGMRELQGELA